MSHRFRLIKNAVLKDTSKTATPGRVSIFREVLKRMGYITENKKTGALCGDGVIAKTPSDLIQFRAYASELGMGLRTKKVKQGVMVFKSKKRKAKKVEKKAAKVTIRKVASK